MLTIIAAAVLSGSISSSAPMSKMPSNEVAVMCMKKGEYTSGMNKICVYDCLGSDAAITVGAVDLCPLTINN
ncbi:hypothetical protein GOA81_18740 [Sinorhizobium meliloti]|jgi:hypothetical protein|uniref:hypothetical protein n=1 Tax=Rhizobium meliloti TaxID=382 RepID=UPI000FD9A240|nr:hypothetical protein [Sinorhizobium meliloti]MDX1045480.1 hypothetical protein [Sinorhizobium medicae]MDW9507052.1 hypothetical protein [Sinorhizobium meliloti]MDW9523779.1 hypothetical protein [Sinorhizobium meliloti]MDW9799033.1 hypothetical protein [Sinorhizobium meliloti]MDW9877447.1 hypothetical protein [Sinorhizobium meliloti]